MEELYKHNAQMVYRFLFSRCKDAQLSEDLTQETFLRAFQSMERFDGSCKLSTWLCQIARHKLYRPTMLNVAVGVLKDHHLAEDAVQEAFMRIARNLHKIGDVDCPPTRAYVVTIVRNVSLSMVARLQRQVPIERLESEDILDDSMEDIIFNQMDYELVLSIIQTLPQIYRETLLLYYVEERNTIEIAQRIGASEETVKKRLQRGRRMVLDGLPDEK